MTSGELTGGLLRDVSRSFYLTISWLPVEMRPAVAVAYLLARATDTVADSGAAPVSRRVAALEQMQRAICSAGAAAPAELAELLRTGFAPQKQAEAELLARFSEALAALQSLPPAQAELVRHVLDTIVQGQLWDLSFFEERLEVLSDEQTRLYTYRVAGCVGRFWTKLGLCTLGEGFCDPAAAEDLEEAGVRYGCGLQLVNILRDLDEDMLRGRRYLCSDPLVWRERAERYLRDGVEYSRRLRSWRLRFASMLPALLGLKTLKALRRAKPGERVKISRASVYVSMLRAAFSCL